MPKLDRIYTKTGDAGMTGLGGGQRVPKDDILIAVLHFKKENGELSSVALDEHTQIERLSNEQSQAV